MRRIALAAAFLAILIGAGANDDFKREGEGDVRAAKDSLEGKAPPALDVNGWVNTDGKELKLEDLKGKVVILDFWGVWCGPCRASMPHMKELLAKHKGDGLVTVGIHTTDQGEKMAEFATKEGLSWPIAIDVGEKTVKAFHVDSYPDYYLIDRAGNLRFADLANNEVDRAVEMLLKEK